MPAHGAGLGVGGAQAVGAGWVFVLYVLEEGRLGKGGGLMYIHSCMPTQHARRRPLPAQQQSLLGQPRGKDLIEQMAPPTHVSHCVSHDHPHHLDDVHNRASPPGAPRCWRPCPAPTRTAAAYTRPCAGELHKGPRLGWGALCPSIHPHPHLIPPTTTPAAPPACSPRPSPPPRPRAGGRARARRSSSRRRPARCAVTWSASCRTCARSAWGTSDVTGW